MRNVFEGISTVIGGLVILVGVLFLAVLLGTLVGALCGWVVGLFFGDTILGILASIGITGFKMWQIGAFLGFVGGFFKPYSPNKKD